jgi:polysaccharide export outer membrane protein
VVGQVYVPTNHAYQNPRSMRDYIELSGGPTVIGRLADAYAIQANGAVLTLKGRGLRFSKRRPQPGATIYVPLNVDRMNTTEWIQAWTCSLVEVALFAGVIL